MSMLLSFQSLIDSKKHQFNHYNVDFSKLIIFATILDYNMFTEVLVQFWNAITENIISFNFLKLSLKLCPSENECDYFHKIFYEVLDFEMGLNLYSLWKNANIGVVSRMKEMFSIRYTREKCDLGKCEKKCVPCKH